MGHIKFLTKGITGVFLITYNIYNDDDFIVQCEN